MTSAAETTAACILSQEIRTNGQAHPTRICVIDIGTNSFHAVIGDAFSNGTFHVKDKLKNVVNLGRTGMNNHLLTADAMDRGFEALRRIQRLAEGRAVEEYMAFATSAVRESSNGGDFIRRVRKNLGIDIRPIPADFEALLIYKGVRQAVDLDAPALLVDIGGGSTEFVVGTDSEVLYKKSLKLGAARMTERFVTTDPISDEEYRQLTGHYRHQLKAVLDEARKSGVVEIVGSSGTMKNLAREAVDRGGESGKPIYNQTISAGALLEAAKAVIGSVREERMIMSSIDEKRIDQIVAGAVLVETLLEELGVDQFRVSPDALREGMSMYFIEQNSDRLEQIARFDSVRRRSVYRLGYTCRWDEPHANHVASLAVLLFDACRSLHGLELWERELLEYAALLHDIGYHISRKKHHKHSRYIIEKSELRGFTSEEISLIANTARYHRRSLPKSKHDHYTKLSRGNRKLVRKLASFLRLAEGLDRSHYQNIRQLSLEVTPDTFRIGVNSEGDPQLEIWSAQRSAELFEETYDRKVVLSLHEADAEYPEPGSAVKGKHLLA